MKRLIDKSRRELLLQAAGVMAASMLSRSARAAIKLGQESGMQGLNALGAREAVARMKAGDFSAEAYASALLARADEKKDLNAFIHLDKAQVFKSARDADGRRMRGELLGALHGLPIPVKDSVFTKDYPTTAGTGALRSLSRRVDAAIIEGLQAEGAFVMGKTNLHELSTGFTSNNAIFGPVRNPCDPTRIPGGSSGGTAVAVATGMAPLGIAEDTAGSIRVPAALCGIVGFRPTTGRYPNSGVVPLTPSFDQLGPHARRVEDIVLFDSVVTGGSGAVVSRPLREVRLGVPRGYFHEGLEAATSAVIEDSLHRLEAAGATLVNADVAALRTLLDQSFLPILFHETWGTLDAFFRQIGIARGLAEVLEQASPAMKSIYEGTLAPGSPGAIPEDAYQNAVQSARPALRNVVSKYFSANRLNAMVFPTTLCSAIPIGDEEETVIDGRTVPLFAALGQNTIFAPCCELPALTLPAGLTSSGLPVGIEFDAPTGADEKLLALGLSFETALGPLPKMDLV